ncbi:hypothetical protein AYI70_g721 [Smittium culicis]|uniref:Uncharacterized protein n=1 Tax=Smittium culicis TaxID=133412 RepID=A0A1R1YFJ9_9FUNG|nr:hypothetical protein AYI70_g721 [Smittium culicis]
MLFDSQVLSDISNNPTFETPSSATVIDINNAVDWYINTLATVFQDEEPWLEESFLNSCYSLFSSILFKNFSHKVNERIVTRAVEACVRQYFVE